MDITIDLSNLINEQYKLDKAIQDKHGVTYRDTYHERKLALLVELGEFANTTRCFKFWSNKGMDSKQRVLDEAADCLHFYLSLMLHQCNGNINGRDWKEKLEYVRDNRFDNKQLTDSFRRVIELECKNLPSFKDFIDIIYGLGYTWDDLEKAYYKKLKVNYDRQENNY